MAGQVHNQDLVQNSTDSADRNKDCDSSMEPGEGILAVLDQKDYDRKMLAIVKMIVLAQIESDLTRAHCSVAELGVADEIQKVSPIHPGRENCANQIHSGEYSYFRRSPRPIMTWIIGKR